MKFEKFVFRFYVVIGVFYTVATIWNLFHGCPPLGPICTQ